MYNKPGNVGATIAYKWIDGADTPFPKVRSQTAKEAASMRVGEPFLLHPDNRALMEGRVSYKHLAKDDREKTTRLLALIILFSIIVALFLIGWTITEWQNWGALRDSGVRTQGVIADRRIDTSGDGTSYHVRYTYQHIPPYGDGAPQTFIHERQVSRSFYEHAEQGMPIDVVYTPDDPTVSTLDVGLSPPWQITLFSSLGIPAFLGIPIFLRHRLARHNDIARRLRQGSRKLLGEVVSCQKDLDDDICVVTLHYRFTSPQSNQMLDDTHVCQRDDLSGARMPAPGTPVIVLYRDDTTFRVL
jgi:hypothetical protein